MRWTTIIPMKDGTTKDHGASLKVACGDGPEDLLSAARLRFLLDSVLLDLYRLWPILFKCNIIIKVLIVISTDICHSR